MNVLILSGSSKTPSHTFVGLEYLARQLEQSGALVTLWNLHQEPLPFADANYHSNPSDTPHESVKRLVELAETADAFVLGSPNYHNSYSGLLKNALDHLNYTMFLNKPVALFTHNGGIRNTEALTHLRIVVRGLLGVAIPMQAATCDGDYSNMESTGMYELVNSEIKKRLHNLADQLIFFADRLSSRS